jgi:NAD(P)-dependent dehydrogenase (short-subunit alcohol dehydrogenase family)
MNPTYDFSGQVALVTGAGAGMGLDTARALAADATTNSRERQGHCTLSTRSAAVDW